MKRGDYQARACLKTRPRAGAANASAEVRPGLPAPMSARELKERFFGISRERSGDEFAAFMRS